LSLRVRMIGGSRALTILLIVLLTSSALGLILSVGSGQPTLGAPSLLELLGSSGFNVTGYKAVAIMFDSETCPTCKEMRPYWGRIESNPPEGVLVTHVVLQSSRGSEFFALFGVTQTPTFIILTPDLREVRRYTGAFGGSDVEKAMRDWITGSLKDGVNAGGFGVELIAYPVLGALIALSPCTAPLLAIYITLLSSKPSSRVQECFKCSLLALIGLMVIGLTLIVSITLASNIIEAAPTMISTLTMMMGFLTILNPGIHATTLTRSGSRYFVCLAYSIIVAQCSLPLLTGALISTVKTSIIDSFTSLTLLALGLTLTLAFIIVTSGSVIERVYAIVGAGRLTIVSGILLVTLGAYMLFKLY
jgi:thiol-disulfide isomerase/thioredoxin